MSAKKETGPKYRAGDRVYFSQWLFYVHVALPLAMSKVNFPGQYNRSMTEENFECIYSKTTISRRLHYDSANGLI